MAEIPTLSCPNCGALNTPRTVICASCGVNLADFRAALPRIQEIREDRANTQQIQLEHEALTQIAEEATRARARLKTQIRIAATIAAGLAVLIIIVTASYARQQQLRRRWLAEQYEMAVACLVQEDYQCARDGLEAILQAEEDYADAPQKLSDARYGLAQQYVRSGQWQAAVDELDALLKENPDEERALSLLGETYDRWIADALGRADIITVLRLQLQRDARFAGQ